MILYVVRHGKTVFNKQGKVCGDEETLLTNEGVSQAKRLGIELSNINFDLVFSSPLLRAYDTAKYITNKDIILDNRLIERDYGDNEGKLMKDTNPKELWNYYKNTNIYNVEKVKDVFNRVNNLLDELKEKYARKTILIVTHSGISRVIHYIIRGIPEDGDLTKMELNNCDYQKYEMEEL